MSPSFRPPHAPRDEAEPLGRGIAAIVLTGIALGLGYNALALEGGSHGLPWITQPKVLDSLESTAVSIPEPVREPAAAPDPATPVPAQAPVPQATQPEPEPQQAAAAPAAPEVPDLGRPLQVQLPMVKQFWDAGAALIVDAREPAEYAAGHIPGAINLPYDEVIGDPERLDALDPGGRPIICYCGGGSCEVSIHLAEALVYQSGKKRVLVFMGGWPEWEGAGYPVEK